MTKIKRNSKSFYIVFGIIDGLFVTCALILLFFSLLYQGNLAPNLFSHRIYIMDTDAFSLVKKGSAVIADQVNFDEILPGNIIIFIDDAEKTAVGEVQKSDFENNVYTFTIKNDAENILTVGQSHILGKGMYYSEFLGGIVSFATSPAGLLCIAILPCAAFCIWEVIAAVKRKAPLPTVDTVKKQYETPTYIPVQPKNEKGSNSNEQIPLEDRIAFAEERQKLVEAAGLYAPSPKKTEPVKQTVPSNRPAVNEKDIDKLIQQAKAGRLNESSPEDRKTKTSSASLNSSAKQPSATPVNVAKSAYERIQKAADSEESSSRIQASPIKPMELDIDDKPLRRIDDEPAAEAKPEPKRSYARNSPRLSRLDSLLQEESADDSKYDINNILRNIEKK